ncbi:hypothetical protein EMO89_00340 [Bifidobacterium tissieri]|uniref:Uncharacterized protein n=1 Tax=Bifidobacterium tissieri TaxID=1630162 RepID=A0A5M9ZYR0_9BIFI|nr:hypothetical protein [Bifidobacterium tissieri]KAA8832012.1 hypothetical protein EMO89_00340 [Bifidobacterium tissieri]
MMSEARGGVKGSASDVRGPFKGNASGPVPCVVQSVRPDGSIDPEGMTYVDSVDALVQATLLRRAQPRELGLGRVGEMVMHGHEADWRDVNRVYRSMCLTNAILSMKDTRWGSIMTYEGMVHDLGILYGTYLRRALLNTARLLNSEPSITTCITIDDDGVELKRTDELMRSELERLGLDEYADILDLPAPTIDASRRDAERTLLRAEDDDDETGEFLRACNRGPAYAEEWYASHR